MREIKFRAYWPGIKKMKYFIPGNFEDTPNGWAMTFIQSEQESSTIFIGKAEIMQFTGGQDKTNKDIYEGDIYHMGDPNIKYVVVWRNCAFVGKQLSDESSAGLTFWKDKIEVIGNIHQNPELLKNDNAE